MSILQVDVFQVAKALKRDTSMLFKRCGDDEIITVTSEEVGKLKEKAAQIEQEMAKLHQSMQQAVAAPASAKPGPSESQTTVDDSCLSSLATQVTTLLDELRPWRSLSISRQAAVKVRDDIACSQAFGCVPSGRNFIDKPALVTFLASMDEPKPRTPDSKLKMKIDVYLNHFGLSWDKLMMLIEYVSCTIAHPDFDEEAIRKCMNELLVPNPKLPVDPTLYGFKNVGDLKHTIQCTRDAYFAPPPPNK